jgi:hypothetical protein
MGFSMKYSGQRFTVNRPAVFHETFDGEVVVINLKSGNYYSLQGSAAYLWSRLVAGAAGGEILDNLAALYPRQAETIEKELEAFIGLLLDEELLVPNATAAAPEAQDAPEENELDLECFQKPELNRYTDMQELLLLDPIHEVDDLGWPARAKDDDG